MTSLQHVLDSIRQVVSPLIGTDGAAHVRVASDYRGAYPASYYLEHSGSNTDDNSVLLTTGDLTNYNEHIIHSTAGAVDVEVTVDGTNWTSSATAPIAMQDMTATASATFVTVTAAGKVYKLIGKFKKIRLVQNGATAATAKMASYAR